MTRNPHLVRLAVHDIEDLCDALRWRSSRPKCTAQQHNSAQAGIRWLTAKTKGRRSIESVDLFLNLLDWNKLAEICNAAGMQPLAVRILRQLDAPGDPERLPIDREALV